MAFEWLAAAGQDSGVFRLKTVRSLLSVSLLCAALLAAGCGDDPKPASSASVVVPDGPGTTPWVTTTTTVGVQAEAIVGYDARRCGFDLNGNGTRGQNNDCRVCDGSTTDVNNDGVEDNLIYVDCDRDGSGNGSASNPFATIEEGMDALDSPRDEVVQAVCFRGSCRETVVPRKSGASSNYEIEGFRAPRYPMILSGWDEDGDGAYPPFDEDDFAELNGEGLDFAIENRQGHSRLEFAHFSARNFGRECPDEGGFMRPALGGEPVKYISVHDVELININRECQSASGRAVFLTFLEGSVLEDFLVHNVLLQNYGGYAVRGSGVGTEAIGPYRFDKLTVHPHGPEDGMAHGIKLWDHINGVQILRSRFEARPDRWNPCPSSVDVDGCEPVFAISAAQCSRDWTIWGNIITDWKYAIEVQPDAGQLLLPEP